MTEATNNASVSSTTIVCLPPLAADALGATLSNLAATFGTQNVLAATPDASAAGPHASGITLVAYTATGSRTSWIPSADDYIAAFAVAREHNADRIVLLGNAAETIAAETFSAIARELAAGKDLILPRYETAPHEALVNAGILYPVTRALFAHNAHFPLPVDVAFTARMGSRLAAAAQKLTAASLPEALVWPVPEAAIAGLSIAETPVGKRFLPQPAADNVSDVLASVTASLFTDVEAKAAFWQRARLTTITPPVAAEAQQPLPPATELAAEITHQIADFHNAYANLRELWSLVLPPHTLLTLKKLSLSTIDTFRMPEALWARIVYDFLLAYRLRTINRGHLLGAFTPLYFAWVASHIRVAQNNATLAAAHIQNTAAAFENEKPYLVARWRWPDRFNP